MKLGLVRWRVLLVIEFPGAGRGDHCCPERLGRLSGNAAVNQDQFQRDRFRVAICVANCDPDSAATIQIDDAPEILVGFHEERAMVDGVNVEHLWAAMGLTGQRRAEVGCFEKPINAFEWDLQRLGDAMTSERGCRDCRGWSDQAWSGSASPVPGRRRDRLLGQLRLNQSLSSERLLIRSGLLGKTLVARKLAGQGGESHT